MSTKKFKTGDPAEPKPFTRSESIPLSMLAACSSEQIDSLVWQTMAASCVIGAFNLARLRVGGYSHDLHAEIAQSLFKGMIESGMVPSCMRLGLGIDSTGMNVCALVAHDESKHKKGDTSHYN